MRLHRIGSFLRGVRSVRGESEFCVGKGELETWRGDIKDIAECVGLYLIATDGQVRYIAYCRLFLF